MKKQTKASAIHLLAIGAALSGLRTMPGGNLEFSARLKPVGEERRRQFKKDNPEIVEQRLNDAEARRQKRRHGPPGFHRHHGKQEWQPKPSSAKKFLFAVDHKGQIVKPRWAHQPEYAAEWARIAAIVPRESKVTA